MSANKVGKMNRKQKEKKTNELLKETKTTKRWTKEKVR